MKPDGGIRRFLRTRRVLFFPFAVLIVYGILFLIAPERASTALGSTSVILRSLIVPLCLAFAIMALVNLFLSAGKVARLLGKGSGVQGVALSTAGGIISTGPIYAWYPLLKDLKEKGASYSSVAIFLNNRAVKPFLLPLMVFYFGWIFTVALTVLTILFAIATGYVIQVFMPARTEAVE